jgi:hypothetical protein
MRTGAYKTVPQQHTLEFSHLYEYLRDLHKCRSIHIHDKSTSYLPSNSNHIILND